MPWAASPDLPAGVKPDMSTVVYHGFRLAPAWNNPRTLQRRLQAFQKVVRAAALRRAYHLVAELAVEALDHRVLGLPPYVDPDTNNTCGLDQDPWKWARSTAQVRMDKARRKGADHSEDLEANLECTVVLHPRTGYWLARVCPHLHQPYVDLFASLPGVKPYGVDTRTEPPEDLPRKVYQQRVKQWEDTDDRPRLFFECLGMYGWPGVREVTDCVAYQPSKKARVREFATSHCVQEYLKAHPPETGGEMRMLFDAMSWMKTPEGQALYQTAQGDFETRLPDRYEYQPPLIGT